MPTLISGPIGPAIQLLHASSPEGMASALIHLAFGSILLRRESMSDAALSQGLYVGQALHHLDHIWQRLLWGQLLASLITVSVLVPEGL